MLITAEPNHTPEDEDFITFYPQSIIDGMRIGIMKERLASKGALVRLQFEQEEFKSLSITKTDLINILC